MYRVDMYYTVQTLHRQGYSKRKIASTLNIHRDTVTRILKDIKEGRQVPEPVKKIKLLDQDREIIKKSLERGKSAVLIHEMLVSRYKREVAYSTVVKYVRDMKEKEVYIPIHSDPGEEAQVDFGYLGLFWKDGKRVKTWLFVITLSYSRYAYYERVCDQKVITFLMCHIHAFEFFMGVVERVRIDNLKAGVITPDFYEPLIQAQYAACLAHYGCSPVTARIGRGQDKGKVESGVKYGKNNFLPRIDHRDYYRLGSDLTRWNEQTCNLRLHGTTRRIPAEVFKDIEYKALKPLPPERFELFDIETRKVNAFGHIHYKNNYYSVPYQLIGRELVVKSNLSVLRIFADNTRVAVHDIAKGQGQYITREEHQPEYKLKKPRSYYEEKMITIGEYAHNFMLELENIKPRHWHEMIRGILHLCRFYDNQAINLSCKRALSYGAISYQEVKTILEKRLYCLHEEIEMPILSGFGHDLGIYDQLNK